MYLAGLTQPTLTGQVMLDYTADKTVRWFSWQYSNNNSTVFFSLEPLLVKLLLSRWQVTLIK
jgi:hypothetical protein